MIALNGETRSWLLRPWRNDPGIFRVLPRMRKAILVALLTFAVPTFAQDQEMFQRALALHDAGDYDGAIAVYRQLLEERPGDPKVLYELTFSYFSKGDYAQALKQAEAGSKVADRYQVPYLELLGNTYDALSRPMDAVSAYKRGIKIDPRYARIHLNLGVTYTGMNKLREAREQLQKAIELDPVFASAHFTLAEIYKLDGYRVPAILAYGRFLALESSSARARAASQSMHALLTLGVEQKDAHNIQISIDPKTKKDLGDFSGLEMMAALAASGKFVTETPVASEFDGEAATLASFLNMFTESSAGLKRGFIRDTYVPFYAALSKNKFIETLAHIAFSSLDFAGTKEWLASHQEEVKAFQAAMAGR
jgi:tetratricopeptide (TPR) repeat protein